MRIDLVVDLQYGSTGKGLLVGYLAETNGYEGVITCNMPNAGHTYIDSKGQKMIHKALPNGIVSPNLAYVFIGPGSVFHPERLEHEIKQARGMGYLGREVDIIIHPNAMILQPEHAEAERATLSSIASTMQGSMVALTEKMMRDPRKPCLAKDVYKPTISGVTVVDTEMWMRCVNNCNRILAEGSQGFSLGLNQRFWPYCTSRECTPFRMLSDMGLPNVVPEIWGTLRTYPIRVGNTPDGFSGGVYVDQAEISWQDLGLEPEKTTVTQRDRRVFTFSRQQLEESLWHCRPHKLFLNFCNYMDPADLGRLVEDIDRIAYKYNTSVQLCGYGPSYDDLKSSDSR